MRIKPQTSILIVLGIFISGIVLASVFGVWNTQTTKTPSTLSEEYAGEYDPADIRGSYTFDEISSLYDIPLTDLSAAFGLDKAKAASLQCKELGTVFADSPNEIGVSSVRMFVAYYLNLPYTPTEETYLTDMAAQILKDKSDLTKSQLEYLENHIVPTT